MLGLLSIKKHQVFSVVASVVLTVLVVFFTVHGVTYIDTDSVGIATATPGAAMSVKGEAIVEGFVSAAYFTSTSTSNSWHLGTGFGLGTTTPGTRLGVLDNADIAGYLTVEDHLKTSFLIATSTTATSTVAFGATVDTTTLVVDAGGNNVGIATSTFPSVGGDVANVSVGGGSATSTLFLAGGGSVGSQIILKSTDGSGCIAIMATRGASAIDAAATLSLKVVDCPAP